MHTQQHDEAWATLRATLVPACFSGLGTSVAIERLEGLAALLAEDPRVGGVETRDSTTLEFACEIPELIVYTTPEALPDLQASVGDLAPNLGLQLEVGASVHHDDSWRDHWKSFYQPQVFGDGSLLLRPSWIDRRPGDPALEVIIDPGRAFGTGLHESTRLCLELLAGMLVQRVRTETPPANMLDLGCGSGILSLAAARLFPALAPIVAVDIDPEAAETTLENAQLNGLERRLTALSGTLDDLDVSTTYALLVANIRPRVLIPEAARLAARLAPGGYLILSGILRDEGDDVALAYQSPQLVELARPVLNDWCALLYQRVSP